MPVSPSNPGSFVLPMVLVADDVVTNIALIPVEEAYLYVVKP